MDGVQFFESAKTLGPIFFIAVLFAVGIYRGTAYAGVKLIDGLLGAHLETMKELRDGVSKSADNHASTGKSLELIVERLGRQEGNFGRVTADIALAIQKLASLEHGMSKTTEMLQSTAGALKLIGESVERSISTSAQRDVEAANILRMTLESLEDKKGLLRENSQVLKEFMASNQKHGKETSE